MVRILYLLCFYIAATSLPLLTAIGRNLEYEYALMAAWSMLVFLPIAGATLPRRFLPVSGGAWSLNAANEFIWIFLLSPAVALMPGMSRFWLNLCQCSMNGYLVWMLLVAYPAWILAHAAFYGILRCRVAGIKAWICGAVTYACYFFTILYGLTVLWFNPQKRLSHLVLGFLHGPIYDHWIPLDLGIILMRGVALLVATLILFFFWFRRQWSLVISMIACTLLGALAYVLAMSYPSTHNSINALTAALNLTIEGRGFSLHYRHKDALDMRYERNIQVLMRDTQFHVDELTKILGGSSALPKVQVFVYPSEDEKKLWFGGGATDVTDVVTPSIHIVLEDFPHPTLRHELVHALASGFGFYGLGFHPNIAFTEGLAVALAPTPSDISLDEGAAALFESGRIKDVSSLFSPLFWQESGSRAYTMAGSLIQFLIANYGFKAVREIYSGASLENATSKTQAEVVKEWQSKILAGYDKNKVGLYTEALYRQGGVFQDLCPHSKKDLERNINDGFFTRIRQPANFDPEEDYLPWLLSLNPTAINIRSRMWRQEIIKLTGARFAKTGRLETWVETLQKARAFPPETLDDLELAIQESDLLRFLGRRSESIQLLQKIHDFAQSKNIGDSLNRVITVRLKVEELPPDDALNWRNYFASYRSTLPDSQPTLEGPWLLLYSKLRRMDKVEFTKDQLLNLVKEPQTIDPSLPLSFGREYYKILGNRLMELDEYSAAAKAYQMASALSRSLNQESLLELARRASYHGTLGPITITESKS